MRKVDSNPQKHLQQHQEMEGEETIKIVKASHN